MEPCCDDNGVSYYSPFTLEIFNILNINDNFYTMVPPPYPNITDKCMRVQSYSGTYPVDTTFQQSMTYNGNGCINRCSRCGYAVRPCGWPTSAYILWTVNPQVGMTTGTIWYDSGLANWISTNFPGSTILLPTNCLTILTSTPSGSLVSGGAHDGYNYTINSVSSCSDSTC